MINRPDELIAHPLQRFGLAIRTAAEIFNSEKRPRIATYAYPNRQLHEYDMGLHSDLCYAFPAIMSDADFHRILINQGEKISQYARGYVTEKSIVNNPKLSLDKLRQFSMEFITKYSGLEGQGETFNSQKITEFLTFVFGLEAYRVNSYKYLKALFVYKTNQNKF